MGLHENIGFNMKVRRQVLGYSLQKVADMSGMSKANIWELEQGRNPNPTIRSVLAICDALSMPLNDLLGMDVSQPRMTAQELALIAAHRQIFASAATPPVAQPKEGE